MVDMYVARLQARGRVAPAPQRAVPVRSGLQQIRRAHDCVAVIDSVSVLPRL